MELHFRQNSIFVFDTRLAVFYATLHNATSRCLDLGKVEKTDPRSTDYPTDYSTDYPYGIPLIINQIPFFRGKKNTRRIPAPPTRSELKQPPFSFRTSRSSLFYFRPILHRPPSKVSSMEDQQALLNIYLFKLP